MDTDKVSHPESSETPSRFMPIEAVGALIGLVAGVAFGAIFVLAINALLPWPPDTELKGYNYYAQVLQTGAGMVFGGFFGILFGAAIGAKLKKKATT